TRLRRGLPRALAPRPRSEELAAGTLAASFGPGGFEGFRLRLESTRARALAGCCIAHAAARGQQIAGDDHALDFAAAFVNGGDARVPIHTLNVGFSRIADAAMHLHSFVHDAVHHFAGVEFGARGVGAHSGAALVALPRRVIGQAARRFNFSLHV